MLDCALAWLRRCPVLRAGPRPWPSARLFGVVSNLVPAVGGPGTHRGWPARAGCARNSGGRVAGSRLGANAPRAGAEWYELRFRRPAVDPVSSSRPRVRL